MSRVIINGDDFGMNRSCTQAITEAFNRGLITDTTAAANGIYLAEAVETAFAKGFENRIGIHLNLTEGTPLTADISAFPSFVTDGRFNKRAIKLTGALGEDEEKAVYLELTAQIQKLKSMGIEITHADSHHYIHNSPYLLPTVARVCAEQGIGKLRLRRDLNTADSRTAAETTEYNRRLRARGFVTTRHFGRPEDVEGRRIPDLTELLVHPDHDKNGVLIDRRRTEDGFPAGNPLPDIKALHGAELICYAEL